MNFIEKVKGFLLEPSKAFDSSKDDTLMEALKYYLIITAIHSAILTLLVASGLMHGYVLPPSYILLPLYVTSFGSIIFGSYVGLTEEPGIEGAIFLFVMVMIFRSLRVFIGGAVLHTCLKIVGRKKGITQTIKALMYGSTPAFLFHWIPVVSIFAVMWSLVLEIIGTRQLQEISTGRAIVAVFMSIIIVVILSVILQAIIETFVFPKPMENNKIGGWKLIMRNCMIVYILIGIFLISGCVQQGTNPDAIRTEETPDRVIYERLIDNIDFSSLVRGSINISSDSRHVAYVAQVDNKFSVVMDGNKGKTYDGIGVGSINFSLDGKRFVYGAKQSGKRLMVVDGKEEKQYDSLGSPIFSPDSKRVAYVAIEGDKWFMVVDGKEEKQYDGIWANTLPFSSDNKRVAYAAQLGNKWFMVVDGKEEKQYDIISSPIFSPDSKRITYAAELGNERFVVVDGKEEKSYDGIYPDTLIFSPDGNRIVYIANESGKLFVVLDGKEEKHYDSFGAGTLIFSPDSKRVAYVAIEGDTWFVVVDGKEEKQFNGTKGIPVFSPDSNRMAYDVQVDYKWFVVVDGKEEKQYDGFGSGTLTFSPDSNRVAYGAFKDDKQFVVVDGKEEKLYDNIETIIFSPDSNHLAYMAQMGNKQFVVVDGKEGKKFDGIFAKEGKGIIFDSPDSFHYFALEGSGLYLVEERIKLGTQPEEPKTEAIIDKLKLQSSDLPEGYNFSEELLCPSIQTTLFYTNYNDKPYKTWFGVPDKQEHQSFMNPDGDNGSILYFYYTKPLPANTKELLSVLFWGEGMKPSREHPEELFTNDNMIVIWCCKTDSKIKKISQGKIFDIFAQNVS